MRQYDIGYQDGLREGKLVAAEEASVGFEDEIRFRLEQVLKPINSPFNSIEEAVNKLILELTMLRTKVQTIASL
jgi:hypothetical protein